MGAPFDALVADIKQNGLREPILVDTLGRILDGRNRYRVYLAAGVEPRFITWEGVGLKNQSQPSDPELEERTVLELVMSRNLHRRHLNESQRALAAARLAKMSNPTPSSAGDGSRKRWQICHLFPAGSRATRPPPLSMFRRAW